MSTSTETKTKPQAYQLTYEELPPDRKRYAGVWVVPKGADNPFAERIEEIKRRAREAEQAELAAARAQQENYSRNHLRRAVAA